jgi:hypothetical protein
LAEYWLLALSMQITAQPKLHKLISSKSEVNFQHKYEHMQRMKIII